MKEIIIMQFMLCFQRAFYQYMGKARKNDKVTPGQRELNLYISFFLNITVLYGVKRVEQYYRGLCNLDITYMQRNLNKCARLSTNAGLTMWRHWCKRFVRPLQSA